MANREALLRTLEFIKANPEQWDQQSPCRCFAGWTVRLDNPGITEDLDEDPPCGCCPPRAVLYEDERPLHWNEISERAAGLLGLEPTGDLEAGELDLFDQWHDMHNIERMVSDLIEAA